MAQGEFAAGKAKQAWWTLHEAQQAALQIDEAETVVAVFREIASVERILRSAGKEESLTPLDPATDEVITTVLRDGIPNRGYREIEVVRTGGGPSQEPTLIQHPYYYNGDRHFQGPSLRGGPTVVEVTHPHTQCPARVEFNMPTGAPIVEYRERSIEYYFPKMVVRLEFKRTGNVEVDYHKLGNKFIWLQRRIARRDGYRSFTSKLKATGGLVRDSADRALVVPRGIAERLPVLSSLLDSRAKRNPGSLKTPGSR